MSEEQIEMEIRDHLKMVQEESAKEVLVYFKEKKENKNSKIEDEPIEVED